MECFTKIITPRRMHYKYGMHQRPHYRTFSLTFESLLKGKWGLILTHLLPQKKKTCTFKNFWDWFQNYLTSTSKDICISFFRYLRQSCQFFLNNFWTNTGRRSCGCSDKFRKEKLLHSERDCNWRVLSSKRRIQLSVHSHNHPTTSNFSENHKKNTPPPKKKA